MACGFTRDELIGLMEKIDKGDMKYERFFFKNKEAGEWEHEVRTDIRSYIDRCKKCGRTIDEHPQARAPVALRDLRGVVEEHQMALSRQYPHHIFFNPGRSGKTEKVPSEVKSSLRRTCGGVCAICGEEREVSIAHLLKNPAACEQLEVEWDFANPTNFILLCGRDGVLGSCHDMFDKFQISLFHDTGCDRTRWVVAGGPNHLKRIVVPSAPHRRVVHAHLTHALLCGALLRPDDWQPSLSDSPENAAADVSSADEAAADDDDSQR
jgi:hypothetical protein